MQTKRKCTVIDPDGVNTTWAILSKDDTTSKEWDSINWKESFDKVQTLLHRIYVSTQKADLNLKKLRKLQENTIYSYDNLLIAVRRVTQLNKGKNSPGLDNFIVKTKENSFRLVKLIRYHININEWKPEPVKRIYIPKAKGKVRPLDIPTIVDRVIQAIVKNALEPEWEAKSDIGSYGFRPGRGCHDTIEKIFTTFNIQDKTKLPKKQWILDADIKGCFDNISHSYLMSYIGSFPA